MVSALGHHGPAKAGCPYLGFVFSLEFKTWTQKSKTFQVSTTDPEVKLWAKDGTGYLTKQRSVREVER